MINNILDSMNCSYNPEKQEFLIAITSNFLIKYSERLPEFISSASGLPMGVKVAMKNKNTAQISLPVAVEFLGDSDIAKVAVDEGDINIIVNAFGDFVNAALRQELSSIDFVPLSGYPVDKLAAEMIEAISSKRDLCIIPDYKTFLEKASGENPDFIFPQYRVEYMSPEFCDVISYIVEKDMKGLSKLVASKLKTYSWN